MTLEELKERLSQRKEGSLLNLREQKLEHLDLTGLDLSWVDVSLSSFQGSLLNQVNFDHSSLENALFDHCPMHGASFKAARLVTGSFRFCDLGESDISDANLYGAVLEDANLEGIISNEGTQWFRMHCPETGAFLAYKKCFNQRLVQLLVPADARRTSATLPSCRCDKAKVLTIKSFDYSEEFEEAWSLVDENFVYRKGEWVVAENFNPDRWRDSTGGIHYWLTREEAKAY